jgi:deoxyribonuclease V
MDVAAAARLTLSCCARYRMPEPTRLAHHLTNRVRREAKG